MKKFNHKNLLTICVATCIAFFTTGCMDNTTQDISTIQIPETDDNTTSDDNTSSEDTTTGEDDNTTSEDTTNHPPVATDDNATTDEDQNVTIDVLQNDSDIDGDTLTVSIVTNPANGTIALNSDNTITYTPNSNYNGSDQFTYQIDDGNDGNATASVTIDINSINDAPTIDGTPKTLVHQYDRYHFIPLSNDDDNDTLQFYIENQPDWAEFNTSTGELSGIISNDTNYTDIVIGVTDGEYNATLPAFDITVQEAINLAPIYGVATQPPSDGYYYYEAPSKAIDDNLDTYNHTQGDEELNWLQVKLPIGTAIKVVTIYNREDNAYRLDKAKLYLCVDNMKGDLDNLQNCTEVAILEGTTSPQTWTNDNNITGSYLVLKADSSNNLHITEMQVFGVLPEAPYFDSNEITLGVKRDLQVSETVANISAIDFQNDKITYSIVGDVPFKIDSNTGTITKKDSSNITQESYTFDVVATDGHEQSTQHITAILRGCNGIGIQGWNNINGTLISDFENSTHAQDEPDFIGIGKTIDYHNNSVDNFAMVYKTMLIVPQDMNYTFYISGDDQTRLKIAYDENMSNLVVPAVYGPLYTSYQNWEEAGVSLPIKLQTGVVYYIEAILKEDSGSEHISLGWKNDTNGTISLITADKFFKMDTSDTQCTQSCPDDINLSLVTPDYLYANVGTVFSSTQYDGSDASTYNPQKIDISVTLNDKPYMGCKVDMVLDNNSGWIYDANTTTDITGHANAIWVAGDNAGNVDTLQVVADNNKSVTIDGEVSSGDRVRADSIHMHYTLKDTYNELNITAIPLTDPDSTYYSMINWPGSYAGIQFVEENDTKVIFSTWDTNGKDAEIIDAGDSNKQEGFGGEGTGVSVRLLFPPSENGHIEGLPDDYQLEVNHKYKLNLKITHPNDCGDGTDDCTDYAIYFYDLTRDFGPIYMGKLRYPVKTTGTWASSFVEDWWAVDGDTCLNSGRRSTIYTDIAYKIESNNSWEYVEKGSFSAIYKPDNNEICVNYKADAQENGFFMSSGGTDPQYMEKPLIWDGSKEIDITTP
jgi:dTDP-4-dehydrorhamnose 3,5-epimerase-like enzyme